VREFYQGKEVKKDGRRTHKQNILIVCNLKETCIRFKKSDCFSKYDDLHLEWYVLAGASETYKVRVHYPSEYEIKVSEGCMGH
jgi:hypothetical protein